MLVTVCAGVWESPQGSHSGRSPLLTNGVLSSSTDMGTPSPQKLGTRQPAGVPAAAARPQLRVETDFSKDAVSFALAPDSLVVGIWPSAGGTPPTSAAQQLHVQNNALFPPISPHADRAGARQARNRRAGHSRGADCAREPSAARLPAAPRQAHPGCQVRRAGWGCMCQSTRDAWRSLTGIARVRHGVGTRSSFFIELPPGSRLSMFVPGLRPMRAGCRRRAWSGRCSTPRPAMVGTS